jgi:hypothetical protein
MHLLHQSKHLLGHRVRLERLVRPTQTLAGLPEPPDLPDLPDLIVPMLDRVRVTILKYMSPD